MEPSAAQTFEAWATGAAAILSATAVFVGGLWVGWRYVLPRPFEPTWDVVVPQCSVREQGPGSLRYTVEVRLTNTSDIVYLVDQINLKLIFPHEQPADAPPVVVKAGKELHDVFRPGVQRFVAISRAPKEADDSLFHVVTLELKVKYHRPKYLGLFGKISAGMGTSRVTLVDAQSLTLYRRSSKEDTS